MDRSGLFCRLTSPWRPLQREAMLAAYSLICLTICTSLSSIIEWICAGSSVLLGGYRRGDGIIGLILIVISVSWR